MFFLSTAAVLQDGGRAEHRILWPTRTGESERLPAGTHAPALRPFMSVQCQLHKRDVEQWSPTSLVHTWRCSMTPSLPRPCVGCFGDSYQEHGSFVGDSGLCPCLLRQPAQLTCPHDGGGGGAPARQLLLLILSPRWLRARSLQWSRARAAPRPPPSARTALLPAEPCSRLGMAPHGRP